MHAITRNRLAGVKSAFASDQCEWRIVCACAKSANKACTRATSKHTHFARPISPLLIILRILLGSNRKPTSYLREPCLQ